MTELIIHVDIDHWTARLSRGVVLYKHDDHYTFTCVRDGIIQNISQISDLNLRRAFQTVSTVGNPPEGLPAVWDKPSFGNTEEIA